MPHITVEYSTNLKEAGVPELLDKLHEALADQGVDKSRIKTRAIPLDHTIVGDHGPHGQMAHTTLLLLEGRDVALRQKLGTALHETMRAHFAPHHPEAALTLEVREMIKDTYFM